MVRYAIPPVALTFLAPADRCNQKCPACILDRTGEPTGSFALSPSDYALVATQFADAGIPILSVSFQGYEVTLPRSWPYVEAVFTEANRLGVRKSFITNGMLLHRWTDRIMALGPDVIAVSLDGADADENDRRRGVRGAFRATMRSIERFLSEAPAFRNRLKVSSTLFDEESYRSLRGMPAVLRSLGISRWGLSVELDIVAGSQRLRLPQGAYQPWIASLREEAAREGIVAEAFDPFERLGESRGRQSVRDLHAAEFILRLDPGGFLRIGREVVEAFEPSSARRFDPKTQNVVDLMEYRVRTARFSQAVRDQRARLVTAP